MNRRTFLLTSAAAGAWMSQFGWAGDLPDDLRITRIVGFDLRSRRPKRVGKNSRLGVHGDSATDRMVRIFTNADVEGLGNCRAGTEDAAKLLGKNPFDFYRRTTREMIGPLGAGTMPLWDLAGKVLGKPVYQLLGGAGRHPVPVYDGSIYFSDLLPEYENKWQDRFREEIDMGLATGHRAFKVKIGRGSKWLLPREKGDGRDVEVVETIRKHGGDDILIGVDANNGYDLAGAKQFLRQAGRLNVAFAEEMFPETVEQCLKFKRFIQDNGWQTLVADGETQGELAAYKPFIDAQAIDVFQGDMNRFGFEGILTEAAWAKERGLLVAPHNWGSLVGFYMQLHVGRAITNFYRAEHDTLSNEVLIADGYSIKDGVATVPDAAGFGLAINEKAFATDVTIRFDLQA